MDGYMTTDEAAEKLGRTRRRVQQFINSGELPAEKAGRDWMIKDEDVEALAVKLITVKRGPKPKPPTQEAPNDQNTDAPALL